MPSISPQSNSPLIVRAANAKGTTVREAVFALFREFGMTTIFGNPGSTELPMFREFPSDFSYVLGLQEAVVVGMADGYAQASRNAALVNLHSAAGVGNAMGNIFTAFRNRTPLVITAGQQARSILPYDPFLFATQATELPKPYVKWSCEPARAEDVPAAIARAYYMAMQPPYGPTFVSIPVDDWDAMTEPVAARRIGRGVRADPETLAVIAEALNCSARPAFVVGSAVDRDDAWDAVVELAERHNALVWVSPMSGRANFPESHPLFAGFLPASREGIVDCLRGHDLVLALGAAVFTYHVEGGGPHLPDGAAFYQLIDDPEVAAWAPLGVTAVTSLDLGVADLLAFAMPGPREVPAGRAPPPRIAPAADDTISVAYLMQTLADLREDDSIVVEEAPSSRGAMQQYLPIDRNASFFTCSSGGLGYSMPAAVGVALARKGQRVIALIGDGSSMYSIQALYSAVQLKLPMTFVIVNNGRYQAMHDFAKVFDIERPVGTELPGLDFVGLAQGMGCGGARIDRADLLERALGQAIRSAGPFLLEVIVK